MAGTSFELHKSSVLKALEPRREPYWGPPISRGRFVGFRKIDRLRSTWVARMRAEDGKQKYSALGYQSDGFGFDEAKAAAVQWFKEMDVGAKVSPILTVRDACREYVAHLTADKGEKSGKDAQMRLARTVLNRPLADRPLKRLRFDDLKQWRESLGLNPENFNRTLRSFKAALTAAHWPPPGVQKEWKKITASSEKKRRTLFLDIEQRRTLLAHCGDGSLRDFVEGAMLTGARGGELADATVAQFDSRTGTMKFVGKTRLKVEPRIVPLSPAAIALFKRLAKGKKAGDLLFMRDESIMGAAYCDVATRKFHGFAKTPVPVRWHSYDWGAMVKHAALAACLPAETVLYTLRHSWITEALRSGMTTLDAARLSGTSLLMIEKHYGHLIDGAARKRLARLVMT